MITVVATMDGEIVLADSMRENDAGIKKFERVVDNYVAEWRKISPEDAPTPDEVEQAKKDRVFQSRTENLKIEVIES